MKRSRNDNTRSAQPGNGEVPNVKTYNLIYADPPWEYRDKCHAGERGAGYKYDPMSDGNIEDFPVGRLAADNCALFLWATYPKLPEAMAVMKAWGFTYKTVAFTWVKMNTKST